MDYTDNHGDLHFHAVEVGKSVVRDSPYRVNTEGIYTVLFARDRLAGLSMLNGRYA